MKPLVLFFDTAPSSCYVFQESLACQGFDVTHACDHAILMGLIHRHLDLIILGPSLADLDALPALVEEIRKRVDGVPILLAAPGRSKTWGDRAVQAGVTDCVTSASPNELGKAVLACFSKICRAREDCRDSGAAPDINGVLVGNSPEMREIKDRLNRVAASDSNVLVTGETGTGKELVAAYLHQLSPRRNKALITINCAAIPDSLLESELFGYERGAFTGAEATKVGKLKSADGGTVFLDEIGDMSPYSQSKILRVFESKEIQRLGRSRSIPVDLRIIAATNCDLYQLVLSGKFRKDLFFRLNVAAIVLPPLRERREDVPALIEHFVRYFNTLFGRKVQRLSEIAMNYCLAHDFPGNVRELRNLVETIFIDLPPGDVYVADLPAQLANMGDWASTLAQERDRVLGALQATNWNKTRAAQKLDCSRMTLYRKMSQYEIQKPRAPSNSKIA
jgi:DNA-binding NtrC family response regulator